MNWLLRAAMFFTASWMVARIVRRVNNSDAHGVSSLAVELTDARRADIIRYERQHPEDL